MEVIVIVQFVHLLILSLACWESLAISSPTHKRNPIIATQSVILHAIDSLSAFRD